MCSNRIQTQPNSKFTIKKQKVSIKCLSAGKGMKEKEGFSPSYPSLFSLSKNFHKHELTSEDPESFL